MTSTVTPGLHAPAPLTQVDALWRQQQRILHRSALIDYVLAAERQRGQTLTIAITEAAWTIGTLLPITNGRPQHDRSTPPATATAPSPLRGEECV